MKMVNRRSFLMSLAATGALSYISGQSSRLLGLESLRAGRSTRPFNAGLPPLEVAVVGSFVIFVDPFGIKIFTPDIPDRDGHIFFVSTNNGANFFLDKDEKDYSLTGIAPLLRNAPTFTKGRPGPFIDPTLVPVLANVHEPADGMYQFSFTLPFPDDIIGDNPITKGTEAFFKVPVKPDIMELPMQLPSAYRFIYNAYRPAALGLNGHHFDFGTTQPRINLVSKALIPDSVAAQCNESVFHDRNHPQAAMKALGDMVGKDIFLNTSYCGKSFGSMIEKLHITLPDHLRVDGKDMALDKAAADRAPGCFSLVATSA